MITDLAGKYEDRYKRILLPLADKLETHIKLHFNGEPRIDRIKVRAKSISSFLNKAKIIGDDGNLKYSDPLNQIQDQIAARIVTYYTDDIASVTEVVERYFRNIESQVIVPDSESEFGYFGKHYILIIPKDIQSENDEESDQIQFFELQIKTLFQHAWGEANHGLGYKSDTELTPEEKRRIAFTSAQSWGADWIFNELHENILTRHLNKDNRS